MWIETGNILLLFSTILVTPHAGVWIETIIAFFIAYGIASLPMRECGLKLAYVAHELEKISHSPCGSVD